MSGHGGNKYSGVTQLSPDHRRKQNPVRLEFKASGSQGFHRDSPPFWKQSHPYQKQKPYEVFKPQLIPCLSGILKVSLTYNQVLLHSSGFILKGKKIQQSYLSQNLSQTLNLFLQYFVFSFISFLFLSVISILSFCQMPFRGCRNFFSE